ncbi:MAG: sodium:proton antiporter NhaD [Alphaproteobacteria bacterium]|nr:sodium:proton antiporter NhaD [Alphaproteobacteria bacterium]MCB1840066.1 sodium:proton antiporter NhaD [Alphaproteobacteria bacterium]
MVRIFVFAVFLFAFLIFCPFMAEARMASLDHLKVGSHPAGILCIIIFVVSYLAVLSEEYTHLSKSKPVLLGAGLMWVVIALIAPSYGVDHSGMRAAVFHGLGEYASLMLFLLSAMTYIAALEDRNVFNVIRARLVRSGMTYRQLFWATGFIAFFLSSIADNLTTALVIGAVVLAVGRGRNHFISIGCINVVSAANAGGAFCPFGDITTLMVWQAEKVEFFEFFDLFLPSLVNFLVPAFLMSLTIKGGERPEPDVEDVHLKQGAVPIIFLGFLTIAMAVSLEQFLGLPPFIGMMTGLSFLMIAAWFIAHTGPNRDKDFDIFKQVAAAEWDTLLFFFGVIFSVGGLAFLGYLEQVSHGLYGVFGPGIANISVGFFSALVDNIPVMFAVLTMDPHMDHFQWLLITLTAGVGGTMLSIGSAAGVALMGTARGYYTFFSHLKWAPVILLGYAASIGVHYVLNHDLIGLYK